MANLRTVFKLKTIVILNRDVNYLLKKDSEYRTVESACKIFETETKLDYEDTESKPYESNYAIHVNSNTPS
jgi:hypothetical protein